MRFAFVLATMDELSSAFRRNSDGSWTCISEVTIEGPKCEIHVAPGSTFSRGTYIEGLDIAAWIEERASKAVWHKVAEERRAAQ